MTGIASNPLDSEGNKILSDTNLNNCIKNGLRKLIGIGPTI